ncbi:transketolase [Peribacillus sp. NPDC006672]|uniref:transketolase n=1 Tax=Peribacillus sp. NPDC006672 TaxID=3390606 RepID=UPI003CFC2FFB
MSLSGRDAYRDELTNIARMNEKIVCLEADLGGKDHIFQNEIPNRFFNLGIAEMASIDMAAGLAEKDLIPFFSTFASFSALRAAESIKLAMGYMKKNIKIVAAYGGVSGGWFGSTHHSLEDIAIIQSFQNIKIACPHGEEETRKVIQEASISPDPYYIRLSRNDTFKSMTRPEQDSCEKILYQDNQRCKTDLCIISVGEQATEIAKELYNNANNVVHAHLCYVDRENLESYTDELRSVSEKFLVIEEHRATGSTASYLSLLMPDCKVYSHDCGNSWPSFGGTHTEVLEELGFSNEKAFAQLREIQNEKKLLTM